MSGSVSVGVVVVVVVVVVVLVLAAAAGACCCCRWCLLLLPLLVAAAARCRPLSKTVRFNVLDDEVATNANANPKKQFRMF